MIEVVRRRGERWAYLEGWRVLDCKNTEENWSSGAVCSVHTGETWGSKKTRKEDFTLRNVTDIMETPRSRTQPPAFSLLMNVGDLQRKRLGWSQCSLQRSPVHEVESPFVQPCLLMEERGTLSFRTQCTSSCQRQLWRARAWARPQLQHHQGHLLDK